MISRIVLALGAMGMLGAVLYPPWMEKVRTGRGGLESDRMVGFHSLLVYQGDRWINTSMLGLEVVGLGMIVGMLYLATRKSN